MSSLVLLVGSIVVANIVAVAVVIYAVRGAGVPPSVALADEAG